MQSEKNYCTGKSLTIFPILSLSIRKHFLQLQRNDRQCIYIRLIFFYHGNFCIFCVDLLPQLKHDDTQNLICELYVEPCQTSMRDLSFAKVVNS